MVFMALEPLTVCLCLIEVWGQQVTELSLGVCLKAEKMPGHIGNDRVTTQGLTVIYINTEHNVVGVLGCVPGSKIATLRLEIVFK